MKLRYIFILLIFVSLITESVSQSQKVGINTTTPENMLHLKEASTDPVGIQLTNNANSQIPQFRQSNSNIGQSTNASSSPPWSGPANAASSQGIPYFIGESSNGTPTDYLNIRFTFSNPIPNDAVVQGYRLSILRNAIGSISDEYIGLILGSSLYGVNKATSNSWPTLTFSYASYGGETDTWGTNFSPGAINSGSFGVRIQADGPIFSSPTARVDYVYIIVYYTISGTTTTHWTIGTVNDTFKINQSNDLNNLGPVSIDDSGTTTLQALKIPMNAGPDKVLTSDAQGMASWEDHTDMVDDADSDPMNEIQSLSLVNNDLMLSEANTVDLSQYVDNTDDWSNGSGILYNDTAMVGIGIISPSFKLDVEDLNDEDIIMRINNTSTEASAGGLAIGLGPNAAPTMNNEYIRFLSGDGTIVGSISGNASGNISYNTTSDIRLKRNIKTYDKGLDAVKQIRPTIYEMINGQGKEQVGFIAQELLEILPSCVSGDPMNDVSKPLMVDYAKLTPVLVSAIQQQQAIIDHLIKNQKEIRNELDRLKSTIDK